MLIRSGHLDEVSHIDVALIDCILRHRPVNIGYSIVRTMLYILKLITPSLLYGHFITRILKHFKIPIHEPSCRPSKSIGDEAVSALGFEWHNGAWVRISNNKYTFLAPSDDRPLNNVVPTDQISDFSFPFPRQRKRRDRPVSASLLVLPPSKPPSSEEVTLQQLMDEVRTLSVRQTDFQQHILGEHQRLSQQQHQFIHGQRILFEHFGIPYTIHLHHHHPHHLYSLLCLYLDTPTFHLLFYVLLFSFRLYGCLLYIRLCICFGSYGTNILDLRF